MKGIILAGAWCMSQKADESKVLNIYQCCERKKKKKKNCKTGQVLKI